MEKLNKIKLKETSKTWKDNSTPLKVKTVAENLVLVHDEIEVSYVIGKVGEEPNESIV